MKARAEDKNAPIATVAPSLRRARSVHTTAISYVECETGHFGDQASRTGLFSAPDLGTARAL